MILAVAGECAYSLCKKSMRKGFKGEDNENS